nr:HEARO endonuclease [uncultured bacterium]
MSNVFVLDTMERSLNPVHPGRARVLLSSGQAAVFRYYPFTIILKKEVGSPVLHSLRLKIDPGSKTTGLAMVNDASGEVVFAAELIHRGQAIKKRLDERRAARRNRRNHKTRYRKPRFLNRRKPKGWLAPSLESRVANILTWTHRLMRYCPLAALSQEVVKFDIQAMEQPEIDGVEYQQGTLAGYEVREYLLEKWQRACAYCGKKDVPLQVEHIQARAKGGTDRVSNLCLACEQCNAAKGIQDIRDFLKRKPEVLKRILAQAKAPLKDAAAVNATRWALYERLNTLGFPVEVGTGGRTKWNRVSRGLEKSHWIDAACVGASTPETLRIAGVNPLLVTATGHGSRQMCLMDKYGFPRTKAKQKQFTHSFHTGDIVQAIIPVPLNHAGVHGGRMSAKAKGGFTLTTAKGKITDVGRKYCRVLQRSDGYGYHSAPVGAFLSSLSLKA